MKDRIPTRIGKSRLKGGRGARYGRTRPGFWNDVSKCRLDSRRINRLAEIPLRSRHDMRDELVCSLQQLEALFKSVDPLFESEKRDFPIRRHATTPQISALSYPA